ncbi:MAG: DoxX family membrane protein [Planctomycetes bacterium]|nr:DoxX family membrane protein [Planctomycetota bacterium]
MAEETRRVPQFLSGPTAPLAVFLPMRLFVGYVWLQAGIAKFYDGWLASTDGVNAMLAKYKAALVQPPEFYTSMLLEPAAQNPNVAAWILVGAQVLFGLMTAAGAVTRVSATALGLMGLVWFLGEGPARTEALAFALMALTLAISSAGRYLGVDAIFKARNMQIPLF